MLSAPAARAFLLLSWISSISALYFHIGETEKKCFIEEIPDETMVIGELVVSYLVSLARLASSCEQPTAMTENRSDNGNVGGKKGLQNFTNTSVCTLI